MRRCHWRSSRVLMLEKYRKGWYGEVQVRAYGKTRVLLTRQLPCQKTVYWFRIMSMYFCCTTRCGSDDSFWRGSSHQSSFYLKKPLKRRVWKSYRGRTRLMWLTTVARETQCFFWVMCDWNLPQIIESIKFWLCLRACSGCYIHFWKFVSKDSWWSV